MNAHLPVTQLQQKIIMIDYYRFLSIKNSL